MFLSVHPTFGSWVAFRAVVVIDLPATHLGSAPELLPPLLSDEETERAREAFAADAALSEEVAVVRAEGAFRFQVVEVSSTIPIHPFLLDACVKLNLPAP